MSLCLLFAANAWALSWWVPDSSSAEALNRALATSWPGSPVDVRIGAAPPDTDAIAYDGHALVLSGAHPRHQDAPADWTTLVLLARTWSSEGGDDPGWIPDPPVPVVMLPDPVAVPVVPVPEKPARPPWTWGVGVGVRDAWQDGALWSPRLLGRVERGLFAGEIAASFAGPDALRASPTDVTIAAMAAYSGSGSFQSRADVASFSAMFAVAPARWGLHRASFAPFGGVGLELRDTVERRFTLNSDQQSADVSVDATTEALAAGPIVNGGLEFALAPASLRIGLAYGTGGGSAFLDLLVSP